jgi:hypothetical protein
MLPPRVVYGLVATLVGLGLLSATPGMPGVDCLTGTASAAVGGWNVLSAAR